LPDQNERKEKHMRQLKIKVRKYVDENRPNLKFVVGYREAGKRKRRFLETKEQANAFAAYKNAQLKSSGLEGAEFSTSLRVMAQECAERLSGRNKTLKDATDFLLRYLEASEKSCTAVQLVKELLKAKESDGVSESHLRDIRCRLSVFAQKFDGQMVATITSGDIDDWLRSLPFSPVTHNHYRGVIRLAFSFAVTRGYATDNPAKNTAKAKVVGEAPGILTVTETARLLETASPAMLPYLAIGAFAGLRRAELERLDWSDVHFDSDLIEVTAKKAKTARRRFVKMQPNLREWLLPLRKHKGNVTPEDFDEQFKQARAAAGIADWPNNALRHSFASYHLAHFGNQNALALEMGHTDSGMIFTHYRELVKPKDAERYWNIKPAKTGKKIVQLTAQR
jgi:integrase